MNDWALMPFTEVSNTRGRAAKHFKRRQCGFSIRQGSWPSPVNRTWLEARQEIQARLYWGLWCSRGNENKRQVSLLAPWVGGKLVSYTGWGYNVSKGCPRGGLGVFPTPLVLLSAEGMLSTVLWLLTLGRYCFWVFLQSAIFCPEFAPTLNIVTFGPI